jgi:hypothetical protein
MNSWDIQMITVEKFVYFFIALDDNNETKDTVQLLTFVRGANNTFGIITELLSIEPIKDTQQLVRT